MNPVPAGNMRIAVMSLSSEFDTDALLPSPAAPRTLTGADVGRRAGLWQPVKPVFDMLAALVALVAFLPVFAVIAAAVRLDSPGPVFFRQKRFGLNGQTIWVTKFRTMRSDMGDAGGRQQAVRGDARVTRLGAFLRSSCLDELPQIWDVFRGRLALVGPRPHPLEMEIEGAPAEAVIADYHLRHMVRPGITGLAQMRGNRGPVTSVAMGQDRIDHDIEYARDYSFGLDMRLLAATALVPFRRNICY